MTRVHRRPARGFTIILGIMLLGLIAVAVALVTHQMGYELRRTRAAHEDAQLRQLLLAGAQDAATRASGWDRPGPAAPDRWELLLPPVLVDEGASVSLESAEAGPDRRDVRIGARLRGRTADETLEFARAGNEWKFLGVRAGS